MTLVRARHFLIAGQSYGREGYQTGGAYGSFMEAIRRVLVSDAAAVQTRLGGTPTIAAGQVFQQLNVAVDGSAALEANKFQASNYWLEDDQTTNGPNMTAALAAITAETLDRSVILYSHGEQDVQGATTAANAETIADGMAALLLKLRTALDGVSPLNIPVFWDILGPRFANQEQREYFLRDKMLAEIDAVAANFRGAEKYALTLDQTTHPTTDNRGYGRMGAWAGRKVAKWLADGGELRGPSIASAVRTGNSVAVAITVPSGGTLAKPTDPQFFGLFDGSENRIPITNYSWSGNVLTITGASEPAKFRYPARESVPADITRIVRLSDPSDPLFTDEPGLPLESAATVTF